MYVQKRKKSRARRKERTDREERNKLIKGGFKINIILSFSIFILFYFISFIIIVAASV